jgi:hypothetical protein
LMPGYAMIESVIINKTILYICWYLTDIDQGR